MAWDRAGFTLESFEDAAYGAVWSRHFTLAPRAALELSFAAPSWASLDPIDPGTRRIVEAGCRILVDKSRRIGRFGREPRQMISITLQSPMPRGPQERRLIFKSRAMMKIGTTMIAP